MPSITDTHPINSTASPVVLTKVILAGEEKGIEGSNSMSDEKEKEITGKFRYEQDSKRYHRFKIETGAGIVGTVYVPKDRDSMPKKLILEYAR